MPEYKAPRRDLQFVMHEVLNVEEHYKALRGDEEVNRDLIDAIVEEGAKFCENELAPLNRSGDEEGCGFKDGEVTTPKGFKEAYQKYVEGGWPSLSSCQLPLQYLIRRLLQLLRGPLFPHYV